MLMLAVVAPWSADLSAVSVVAAALAAKARCPGHANTLFAFLLLSADWPGTS